MAPQRILRVSSAVVFSVALAGAPSLFAQSPSTALPPTPPTALSSAGQIAPLAAVATPADHAGERHHHARVTCAGGELEIHADNSSLNGILRSVSRCTGMKITGGVQDQRVFGDYGPAAPATVLATLLDGTGSNMLLQETASNQPAELVLTPRNGGPTPPSPSMVPDDDTDPAAAQPVVFANTPNAMRTMGSPAPSAANAPRANGYAVTNASRGNPNVTPVPQPVRGSVVTSPVSIPQPINNVNGSPSNTSPTAGSYPTTDSVPLDSLPTPSTTPATNGIVDAPNPPPAGSDTAKLLNKTTSTVPGTTNIVAAPTGTTTTPGATNTTTPVPTGAPQPGANAAPALPTGVLTPQQVYEQLKKLRQSQGAQATPPPAATPSAPSSPQ